MSDPRRLLDDADALSPDERRVLEAELQIEVPKDAKKSVLGALLAQPPHGGEALGELDPGTLDAGAGAHGAATAAGGTALFAFAKPAAVGFALGVATTVAWVGGRSALERANESTPIPGQPAATKSPQVRNSVAPPGPGEPMTSPRDEHAANDGESISDTPRANRSEPLALSPPPTNAVDASEAPSIRAFSDEPPDGSVTSAESQRVASARTLLRSGNARAALDALARLRTDFPNGVLRQEREALEIEALLATGDRATAEGRARDFLARYPKSPHAAAARRALEK